MFVQSHFQRARHQTAANPMQPKASTSSSAHQQQQQHGARSKQPTAGRTHYQTANLTTNSIDHKTSRSASAATARSINNSGGSSTGANSSAGRQIDAAPNRLWSSLVANGNQNDHFDRSEPITSRRTNSNRRPLNGGCDQCARLDLLLCSQLSCRLCQAETGSQEHSTPLEHTREQEEPLTAEVATLATTRHHLFAANGSSSGARDTTTTATIKPRGVSEQEARGERARAGTIEQHDDGAEEEAAEKESSEADPVRSLLEFVGFTKLLLLKHKCPADQDDARPRPKLAAQLNLIRLGCTRKHLAALNRLIALPRKSFAFLALFCTSFVAFQLETWRQLISANSFEFYARRTTTTTFTQQTNRRLSRQYSISESQRDEVSSGSTMNGNLKYRCRCYECRLSSQPTLMINDQTTHHHLQHAHQHAHLTPSPGSPIARGMRKINSQQSPLRQQRTTDSALTQASRLRALETTHRQLLRHTVDGSPSRVGQAVTETPPDVSDWLQQLKPAARTMLDEPQQQFHHALVSDATRFQDEDSFSPTLVARYKHNTADNCYRPAHQRAVNTYRFSSLDNERRSRTFDEPPRQLNFDRVHTYQWHADARAYDYEPTQHSISHHQHHHAHPDSHTGQAMFTSTNRSYWTHQNNGSRSVDRGENTSARGAAVVLPKQHSVAGHSGLGAIHRERAESTTTERLLSAEFRAGGDVSKAHSSSSLASSRKSPTTANKQPSKVSLAGAKRRLGFKRKNASGGPAAALVALVVHRSEEVVPESAGARPARSLQHDYDYSLSDDFSLNLSADSHTNSSSLVTANSHVNSSAGGHHEQRATESSVRFVDGLGAGQFASRQALVSPYLGDIQLSLTDHRGMLEVEVIRARHLQPKAGAKRLPSPYVKVYLMRERKCIAKFKTSKLRGTLEPLYQQRFIFRDDYSNCILQVIVWADYGKKDRKSLMGLVQIHLSQLDISDVLVGWYKLVNAPSIASVSSSLMLSSKSLRQTISSTRIHCEELDGEDATTRRTTTTIRQRELTVQDHPTQAD